MTTARRNAPRATGRLVFDHAAGIPTEVLTAETQERTRDHEHAPGVGHGGDGHAHDTPAGAAADSAAISSPGDHVDPPGSPPHRHDSAPAEQGHSHPPGTAPHEH